MSVPQGGGKKGGVAPSMNVTPLVDVVLVLLIIFMVVAPLLAKQLWLNLPKKDDTATLVARADAQPLLEELVGELSADVGEVAQATEQVVVADHRRNRGRQAGDRGDQGLGDAGRHHHQRCGPLGPDVHERGHHAPHGAHQSDERRHAADRGEEADPAFVTRGLLGHRPVHRAQGDLVPERRRPGVRGMLVERPLAGQRDPGQQAAGMLVRHQAKVGTGRQAAERNPEVTVGLLDLAVDAGPVPDHRP